MIVDSQDREVLYRVLGVQRLLNLQDAIQLLRSEVKRAGSQRAFARRADGRAPTASWANLFSTSHTLAWKEPCLIRSLLGQQAH
jgi:hypothetical protein